MQNSTRKLVAATATAALMFGGSIAFGVSGFADAPAITTPDTSTTTTAPPTTTTPPTTAPPTTVPSTTSAPPTTILVPGSLNPTTVPAGGTTHLNIPGLAANDPVVITLGKGDVLQPTAADVQIATATTDANGLLDVTLTIPANTVPGAYTVFVQPKNDEHFYFKPITVTAMVATPPAAVTPPAAPAAKPVTATPKFTG